jgi:SpoIID/LytB domain protein
MTHPLDSSHRTHSATNAGAALIDQEPRISVGVLQQRPVIQGHWSGRFRCNGQEVQGDFSAGTADGQVVVKNHLGTTLARGRRLTFRTTQSGPYVLREVTIGIGFHWERREEQTFLGDLTLCVNDNGSLTAINSLHLEDYLTSVISSEMNAEAPESFLRAHAITSRSWLASMLLYQRHTSPHNDAGSLPSSSADEIIRWYDREDHADFDVCADDHCQRYQGISKIVSPRVAAAIDATRGVFLTYGDRICDARFSKACGGITEPFETTWQHELVPYLRTVRDTSVDAPPLDDEAAVRQWILGRPPAYCHTNDRQLLARILPSFDQETTDFYRWTVTYPREELEQILQIKSGIDFGTLRELNPVERGPSGRLVRLQVCGTKRVVIVGKELEIRRWLSPSHLYSSAFVAQAQRDQHGTPVEFTLYGAGWGHGVGLCQIGAAVMATQGCSEEQILAHYFPDTILQRLY